VEFISVGLSARGEEMDRAAANVVYSISRQPTQEAVMSEPRRSLLRHGMLLFVLGIAAGFVEQGFTNPRMGLAAHLEGLMNGTFLLALGAVWAEVRLATKLKTVAYWGILYGAYANLVITTLAAIFGTAAMSPITGTGHIGQPWQESLVTIGFASVGLTMVGGTLLVLWGLRRGA
jgi:hydroxylaminobenzene mutase